MKIKIGSRGSPLAGVQAAEAGGLLTERFPGLRAEFVFIKTSGDRRGAAENTVAAQDTVTVKNTGPADGKGAFVKEIEEALLSGAVDIAVHSMKDMPSALPDGLIIGAVPPRADPSDCVVLPEGANGSPDGLFEKKGARVGTASLRRSCQVSAKYPGAKILPVRGNVGTRINKMNAGEFDALVLASAALDRLNMAEKAAFRFDPARFVPAPGQGALAIECREDDGQTLKLLRAVECAESRLLVDIERRFLARLGGNCSVPAGCFARKNGGKITVTAILATDGQGEVHRETVVADEADCGGLGAEIAERLMSKTGGFHRNGG